MTVHVRTMNQDDRIGLAWCNYRGDQRSILDPATNPLGVRPMQTPFGVMAFPNGMLGPVATGRGPNTIREYLWPVRAEYDDETDRTRVSWSYVAPAIEVTT